MEKTTKRVRSSKPKVRTGCITCKIRRVKCDEVRPQCLRCTRSGRRCDGYVFPITISQATTVSTTESRALEFFYHNTAPQLSRYFGGSFWKTCIQQLALTEPSIRYIIIAIGILHETKMFGLDPITCRPVTQVVSSPLQFYNKAISAIIRRASTGVDALPVVIVACIAFVYLEGLLGRIESALNHIDSGIKLVQAHRDKHGQPDRPWGQSYTSFQSSFLETDLAPMLSSVNMSIREFSQTKTNFSLNPLDDMGIPILGNVFNNLSEARVGLLDLNNSGLKLFRANMGIHNFANDDAISTATYADRTRRTITHWRVNFECLVERHRGRWTEEEKHGIDFLRLSWLAMKIGIYAGFSTEDEWDKHLCDFQEVIRITESLIPTGHYTDDQTSIPPACSFETSLIEPLTLVAFKCRWAHVRRKALDLLLRVPRHEYFFDAVHTHIVLSRVMEIEETSSNLTPGIVPCESGLPPVGARIFYFYIDPEPVTEDGLHCITFLMKQDSTDVDWGFHKEHIRLHSTSTSNADTPPRLRQVIYPSKNHLRSSLAKE